MNHPYPEGCRVRKVNSEDNDKHRDGALGTVIKHPVETHIFHTLTKGTHYVAVDINDGNDPSYLYCVYWDDMPGFPVGISGHRIEPFKGDDNASDI